MNLKYSKSKLSRDLLFSCIPLVAGIFSIALYFLQSELLYAVLATIWLSVAALKFGNYVKQKNSSYISIVNEVLTIGENHADLIDLNAIEEVKFSKKELTFRVNNQDYEIILSYLEQEDIEVLKKKLTNKI